MPLLHTYESIKDDMLQNISQSFTMVEILNQKMLAKS